MSSKKKRRYKPRAVESSPEGERIYDLFIKPFLREYTLEEGETPAIEGMERFFGVPDRRVYFVKSKGAFLLPGRVWATKSAPYKIIPGSRVIREMPRGAPGILRVDKRMPERSELEYGEYIFVLTQAELQFILEKLELVA